ncbi:MAG TPA: glycosyltransferase [Solirubrobacterales bacterium]|nr:glycosyltransferase [Solirubrobacterales bacterium]
MRIGIVSKWFNRGQPVVGRQLRSALDELGHETFVLARPKREKGPRPGALDRDGVWDQQGVTEASAFEIPEDEYLRWAESNSIDAAMFDNHYQFAEISALRASGVRTIGRFVWEHFSQEHVGPATEAFDVIYSMTDAEHERYAAMGIEAVRVHWGCHPEMTSVTPHRDPGVVRVIFPGGFLGHRKPLAEAVEAFTRTSDERLRLLIKAQVDRKQLKPILKRSKRDSRIELLLADQPTAEHLQTFANCDVCLAPARWEGLGLPLYEATAFGMPIVTNDDPPMNEIVVDGLNGLLVASRPDGTARSGITAWTPDVDHMARAIDRVADDEFRAGLSEGALEVRERLSWSRTMDDLGRLIERGVGVPAGAAGSKTQP